MKKWARRRSSLKEEKKPAVNGGVDSSSPPETDGNQHNTSDNKTASRGENKAPDLSNLWSRKQSVEGGQS